jgi:ABC-type multidrug transport system fused ATPase/permease subunit
MKKPTADQKDDLSGEHFEKRVALRLLPYLRLHSADVTLSALLVLVYAGITLYAPRLLGRIVDQAILPRDYNLLRRFVLLFVGLELIRVTCLFIQSYRLQRVGHHDLRDELFLGHAPHLFPRLP